MRPTHESYSLSYLLTYLLTCLLTYVWVKLGAMKQTYESYLGRSQPRAEEGLVVAEGVGGGSEGADAGGAMLLDELSLEEWQLLMTVT